jgi:hypothetical protein
MHVNPAVQHCSRTHDSSSTSSSSINTWLQDYMCQSGYAAMQLHVTHGAAAAAAAGSLSARLQAAAAF